MRTENDAATTLAFAFPLVSPDDEVTQEIAVVPAVRRAGAVAPDGSLVPLVTPIDLPKARTRRRRRKVGMGVVGGLLLVAAAVGAGYGAAQLHETYTVSSAAEAGAGTAPVDARQLVQGGEFLVDADGWSPPEAG